MIRVLVDTNVLVSAVLASGRSDSLPGMILQGWMRADFMLIVSDDIVDEFERTMATEYFRARVSEEDVVSMVDRLHEHGIVVDVLRPVPRIASHPEDDLILAASLVGQADYLVTGDKQLLALGSHGGTSIVTVSDFVSILDAAGND